MRALHPHRSALLCAISALAAILFSAPPAAAQMPEPFPLVAIGFTSALTHNDHSGFGATGYTNDCLAEAPGGRALGFAAGVAADVRLNDLLTITTRLAYETRPAMVINGSTDARSIGVDQHGDSVIVIVTDDTIMFRNDLDCRLLTFDLLLDGNILGASKTVSIHGMLGLGVSRILRGTATRAREIAAVVKEAWLPINEGDVVENYGRRAVYERDREVEGLRDLRLSLKGGLGFTFDLSRALYMRTGVYYDLGLTDLSAAPQWRLGSTLVQLDLLLRL